MKIASIAEVKANLSAYVKASEAELVVITRHGKPVAVLLPMEDDEELERLALAYSKHFQAILTEARDQITTTGGTLMRTSGVRWSLSRWSQVRLLRVAVTKGRGLKPLSVFHNPFTVYCRVVQTYLQDWKLYPQQSAGSIRGLPEQEPPCADMQIYSAAVARECCGDTLVCALMEALP